MNDENEENHAHIVSITSASDWCVWRKDVNGAWYSQRLAAWGLTRGGETVALEPDAKGSVDVFPFGTEWQDESVLRHASEGPPENALLSVPLQGADFDTIMKRCLPDSTVNEPPTRAQIVQALRALIFGMP